MATKEKKIPDLCKGCRNEGFFDDKKKCWNYWPGKKECVTREWIEKE